MTSAESAYRAGLATARVVATLAVSIGTSLAGAQPAAEPELLRHRAGLRLEQPAALVRLPLPIGVYTRSEQPGLADLRIVDADGRRVPFALLAAQPEETRSTQRWRDAALYPLPPRPALGAWASPVEFSARGGLVTVRVPALPASGPAAVSPGWLFDLGPWMQAPPADRVVPPQTLQLRWSGPAEFSSAFELETSSDLRAWRPIGGGQVMALAAPAPSPAASAAAIRQPDVVLPGDVQRFVRLVWIGPGPHPALNGARSAVTESTSRRVEPATTWTVATSPEPPPPANSPAARAPASPGPALHYDLGGVVPVLSVDVALPAGSSVLPVQVQARERADQAWQTVATTVFYRYERDTTVSRPPPLRLHRALRYLRLVPDARLGTPAAAELTVQAELASLVFARQGREPYALLVGSAAAARGDLPIATLVPDLETERSRLGVARLDGFAEVPEAAARAAADERTARWRPWLLWGVLALGVAGLALMVWRLARGSVAGSGPG